MATFTACQGPGDAIGEMNSGDGKIVDTLTSLHPTQAARHTCHPAPPVTLQMTKYSSYPRLRGAAHTFLERSKLKVVILFYDFRILVYPSLHNLSEGIPGSVSTEVAARFYAQLKHFNAF